MSEFLRNAWYVGAWAHDIKDGMVARRMLDEPVVLFRDGAGKVRALEDRCCHRGAPLSIGELVPEGIRCGYHSLTFNADGICVAIPGQRHIPDNARVKSYPVAEKDDFVWVWMGDPKKASADQILDYRYINDHVDWPHKHAVLPVKCNYRLLLDNLLDLTHLGTVHKTTIGGNPEQHASAQMKTYRTPTGVKYIRWMLDSVPPPAFVAIAGFKGRVDRWQEFEYVAPATIKQYSGAVDAGNGIYERANRDGHLEIDPREGGLHFRLIHSITPETDGTCSYYWASANGGRTDPVLTDKLFQAAATAFDEDKAVVEHQQTRLVDFDESRLIDIASDSARLQMFRHLSQKIAEENGAARVAAAE
jgi:vanillate O-demethylase monooxygenase subunit